MCELWILEIVVEKLRTSSYVLCEIEISLSLVDEL